MLNKLRLIYNIVKYSLLYRKYTTELCRETGKVIKNEVVLVECVNG